MLKIWIFDDFGSVSSLTEGFWVSANPNEPQKASLYSNSDTSPLASDSTDKNPRQYFPFEFYHFSVLFTAIYWLNTALKNSLHYLVKFHFRFSRSFKFFINEASMLQIRVSEWIFHLIQVQFTQSTCWCEVLLHKKSFESFSAITSMEFSLHFNYQVVLQECSIGLKNAACFVCCERQNRELSILHVRFLFKTTVKWRALEFALNIALCISIWISIC